MQRQTKARIAGIVAAGTLLLLLAFGIRQSFALFLQPMSKDLGWGREVFSLAIALQNLLWGAAQPFAGGLADRFGGRWVAGGGAVLYIAGVWLMSVSSDPVTFTVGSGLLLGAGMAGCGFAVVLAEIGRVVPPERRTLALGLGTAAGSFGQFAVVPVGQALIVDFGWQTALTLLIVGAALMLPLSMALSGQPAPATGHRQSFGEAVREAARHRGYLLLTAGYFVCGFHVAFIGTHLPAYLVDSGLGLAIGATALSLVGLFNIAGSLGFGSLGDKRRKKYLLSFIYAARSVVILGFILLPLTETTALTFAALMGILWLSTVPLTTGLVGQIFGMQYLGMLAGVTFFSHQIGSFIGVWVGGLLYDRTGSYDLVWWASIALGLVAALLHWPIDDRAISRAPQPAAAA